MGQDRRWDCYANRTLLASLLSVTVYRLAGDVRAIKQAQKDKGVEIVSQIAHPTNPEQQRIALLTVAAGIQQANAEKKPPQMDKLASLSKELLKLTDQGSVPTEAWDATATLISYRSAAAIRFETPDQSSCMALTG
jgi:hypothetical protein